MSSQDRVLLNQFFYDVQQADGQAAYREDRGLVLNRYAFSPALRTAIETTDIGALYQAGANPYLLRFYCVNLGVPEPEYVQALHALRGATHG